MKKIYTSCIAAILYCGTVGYANSATITTAGAYFGTNVGVLDTLLSIDSLANAGQNTETNWVSSILGTTATFSVKTQNVPVYGTDVANLFAVDLVNTPGYYILKNATYWALYQNVNSLSWAVFDASALPSGMNVGAGHLTISHVSEFNANGGGSGPTGGQVPEPSVISLLGLGLLGMGASRLRKTNI